MIDDAIVYEPEVVVSIRSRPNECECRMSMGAYDLNALVTEIFEQLLADFPGAWQPDGRSGTVNDTVFLREGELVRLLLVPLEIDGADWIGARVIAQGRCDL